MTVQDERTELMNAISDVLGVRRDPKGVGSSVHNTWLDPITRAFGIEPTSLRNKYRRYEAIIELLGGTYDPHSDTSEGSPSAGGGTITNAGLRKMLAAIQSEQGGARRAT